VEAPETRYAWNGDVALAYQVVGEGPIDLLYYQGWSSHIDLAWESPYLSRFLRGLSGHRRLILTDKRGWGCSERFSPNDVPPFEALTDDLLVVMDTIGSERAVLFATGECAAVAVLFAATYPQRVTALILCDPLVNFTATDEAPGSMTQEGWDDFFGRVRAEFPQPRWWNGPEDHPERDWFFKYVRAAVAPGALLAEFRRFLATDVRAVLPSVQVPTLVLVDPSGEGDTDPRNGRFAASRIPGASLVEVPDPGGPDWHHWYGRANGIVREIGTFMKGIVEEEARFDRVLATVMFTDIVGSADAGRAALAEPVQISLPRLISSSTSRCLASSSGSARPRRIATRTCAKAHNDERHAGCAQDESHVCCMRARNRLQIGHFCSRCGICTGSKEAGGRLRLIWQRKMPIYRQLSGSDGTRTRDLRRDRPVLLLPGWAGLRGVFSHEQDVSPLGLRGLRGAGGSFRHPPAGYLWDAPLS
jgi:pimeloyl-ACP methyl ester carboxylesterase